jgi:hypothetical protein
MRKLLLILISTAILSSDGIFSIGHKNFSFHVGQDSVYGNNYTVIGISFDYFIIDNLSTGVSYTSWFGDDPTINKFTIPVTYYIPISNMPFNPYIGTFYSHTIMGDDNRYNYNDYDSYGGRFGLVFRVSPNSYISVGWVQEVYDDGVNSESRGYSQISGGISF